MLEVTVKTLDGKNRSFCVPDDITVKEFKEKIASSIEITADTQRLIFHGRVLQDDKPLNEFDVNGKVIHAVARPPPSARGPNASTSATATEGASATPPSSNAARDHHSFVLGSFTLPMDATDPQHVQNVVQNVISGMGDIGRNARVTTRSSADGSSVDVHINLGHINVPQVSESQSRLNIAQRMIRRANRVLDRLQNQEQGGSGSPMETSTPESGDASPPQSAPAESMDVSESNSNTESSTNNAATSNAATSNAATSNATASAESSTNTQTTTTEGATNTATEGQGQSSSERSNNGDSNQPRGPTNPPLARMSELLGEVFALNERVQPYLQQIRDFSDRDPQFESTASPETRQAQQTFTRVMEVMHYISHAYHNISDLRINASAPPPRVLYAQPTAGPTLHGAIIQQAVPVSAQINVSSIPGGSPSLGRRNPAASTAAPSGATPSAAGGATASTRPAGAAPARPPGAPGQPQVPPIPNFFPGGFNIGGPRINVRPMSNLGGQFNLGGGALNLGGTPLNLGGPGQNPFVFMEVGPGSVTMNSISAHVVPNSTTANAASQASASGATAGSPNSTTGTQTPSAAPPTNSTGTSTNSNAATNMNANAATNTSNPNANTSGTQTAARPHGTTVILPGGLPGALGGAPPGMLGLPGMPGMPGMPGATGPDPHLHCQSNHFAVHRAAMAAGLPGAFGPPGAVPTSTAAPPGANGAGSGQAPPAGGVPEGAPQQFADMVSNILQSFVGPQGGSQPPSGTAPPTASTAGTQSSSTTGTSSTTAPPVFGPGNPLAGMFGNLPPGIRVNIAPNPAAAGGARPMPNFMSSLMNILQGTQTNPMNPAAPTQSSTTAPTAAPSSSNSAPGGSTSGSASGGVSDEVFAELVQGISSHMAQAALGQRPQGTIADFLQNLGQNFDIPQGEGLLTDTFNVVAQNLTFPDFMAVFYGQSQPLCRLRTPLQNFIRTRVLNNTAATEENIQTAVERLIVEMRPDLTAALAEFEGREDINLVETMNEFLRQKLTDIITFIMNATDDATFGAPLKTKAMAFIREFLGLSRYCFRGGEADLHRFVQSRIRSITQDVNPGIQQWMTGITTTEINRLLPTATMTPEQCDKYIKRGASPAVAMEHSPNSSPSEGSYMSAESDVETPVTARQVPSCSASGDSKSSEDPRASVNGPVRVGHPRLPSAIVNSLPAPPTGRTRATPRLGSQSWHQVVPQEWIPVIAGDVESQTEEPVLQAPFSDAYINGMPAKRRKLMSGPSGEQVADPSSALPASLQRAIAAANVEPSTSTDALLKDAQDSDSLQSAFLDEVQKSVRQRVDKDSDYVPVKYPNTERVFRK